jgi:hypothetical protein
MSTHTHTCSRLPVSKETFDEISKKLLRAGYGSGARTENGIDIIDMTGIEIFGVQSGVSANARQVGGDHYRTQGSSFQHWDMVVLFELGYFEGQATKYLFRWRNKNGIQDLEKAKHYIEKLIEVERAKSQGDKPGA